ncbi:MBL fold metallo-hydrolase [Eggerthellaceae bacterium 3-80]|nr:MBL fold metallo-hydrolase [bacterium D16-34]
MTHQTSSNTYFKLHVLASGSKGNASIVERADTGEGIVIDCGICKRDFFVRCEEVGFDVYRIKAILITHEHSDHTKGLGVVLRGLAKLGVSPLLMTHPAIVGASTQLDEVISKNLCTYMPIEPQRLYEVSDICLHVFATSHDAVASLGFRFMCGDDALGFITDTGVVLPEAHNALLGVRILALESNHDIDMLEKSEYPYNLKMRVQSNRGHLSNDQAAVELSQLLHAGLEQVVAMHVSQNNNTYRLPVETLQRVLSQADHPACVRVAYQDRVVSVS